MLNVQPPCDDMSRAVACTASRTQFPHKEDPRRMSRNTWQCRHKGHQSRNKTYRNSTLGYNSCVELFGGSLDDDSVWELVGQNPQSIRALCHDEQSPSLRLDETILRATGAFGANSENVPSGSSCNRFGLCVAMKTRCSKTFLCDITNNLLLCGWMEQFSAQRERLAPTVKMFRFL